MFACEGSSFHRAAPVSRSPSDLDHSDLSSAVSHQFMFLKTKIQMNQTSDETVKQQLRNNTTLHIQTAIINNCTRYDCTLLPPSTVCSYIQQSFIINSALTWLTEALLSLHLHDITSFNTCHSQKTVWVLFIMLICLLVS